MEVKEAVSQAKHWLTDVMSDEHIGNIGLEGVEFDHEKSTWLITLGFSRPLNKGVTGAGGAFAALTGAYDPRRIFRIIAVNDADGKVQAMKRPADADY